VLAASSARSFPGACALILALLAAPRLASAQAPPPADPMPPPVVQVAPAKAAPPLVVVTPAPVPAAPTPTLVEEVRPGLTPPGATLEQEPPLLPEPERRPPDLRASAPYFPFNLALLHPLSTNASIPDLRTNFALGVILGRVGFVDGLQIAAVASLTHDLHGVQLGAAGLIDGVADGVQLGAVFAFTDGPLRGAQIAGFLSWGDSTVSGLQLSGLINRTTKPIEGVQIAGLTNWSNDAFTGLQLSGAINQARGFARGVQIAGALNAAYGNLDGVQIGTFNIGKVRGLQLGVINISADTEGTQIGIINIARRSQGLQVGVVNITDNLKGESLGIASLPREGGIHLALWGSNSLSGNLGVKFGSKIVYSILSGALSRENKQNIYGGGIALGVHFPILTSLAEGLAIAGDVGGYRLVRDPGPTTAHDEIYKGRVLLSYEIVKHFSFFAGGGVHVNLRGDDKVALTAGPEICGGLEL
jgi:hypothetical protein